jgi:hypothetical protein
MSLRLWLVLGLTVAWIGAVLKLGTYRSRHGLFELSWDWFDPKNYEVGAGRWIGIGGLLFLAVVLAWVAVASV